MVRAKNFNTRWLAVCLEYSGKAVAFSKTPTHLQLNGVPGFLSQHLLPRFISLHRDDSHLSILGYEQGKKASIPSDLTVGYGNS